MMLTISLPSDAESKLRQRANAVGQELSQYVEQLVARDIAVPATEPIIRSGGAMASSLEDQYQQGYTTTPEEIADVVALLPHLAIESEEWT